MTAMTMDEFRSGTNTIVFECDECGENMKVQGYPYETGATTNCRGCGCFVWGEVVSEC